MTASGSGGSVANGVGGSGVLAGGQGIAANGGSVAGANGSANVGGASSNGISPGTGLQGAMSSPALCGNGIVEVGETCDPATTCPSPESCRSTDTCLMPMALGSPAACNAKCEFVPIQVCLPGDGCCPATCNSVVDTDCSASCGDGVIGIGETCEPANPAMPCPVSCDDMNPCTKDVQTGTPAQCNVVCTHTPIGQPADNDTCCPPTANATNDSDCRAVCGNGAKEGAELCDGPDCPSACNDRDPCTMDVLMGTAAECTAACSNSPITQPRPGDGCCPPGANSINDSDCSAMCRNGVKEGSEKCDGADCPNSCDDRNPCTMDTLVGSAAQCNAECTHRPITLPAGGDGCCPLLASANTDNDCDPVCGNGIKEPGEACDGDCRSCDDRDPCTRDSTVGSASQCNVKCTNTKITSAQAGDGCCPATANANNDGDCTPDCGNGVVEKGERCDGDCPRNDADCDDGRPCTHDYIVGSASQCDADCANATCDGTPVPEGSNCACFDI